MNEPCNFCGSANDPCDMGYVECTCGYELELYICPTCKDVLPIPKASVECWECGDETEWEPVDIGM